MIWRSLSHESVLPFLGIHEDKPASLLFLVSPYMQNGTLSQWRAKSNPSVAEIQKRVRLLHFLLLHQAIDLRLDI